MPPFAAVTGVARLIVTELPSATAPPPDKPVPAVTVREVLAREMVVEPPRDTEPPPVKPEPAVTVREEFVSDRVTEPPRTGVPPPVRPVPAVTVIESFVRPALGMVPESRATGTVPAVSVPVTSTVHRLAPACVWKFSKFPVGEVSVALLLTMAVSPLTAWSISASAITGASRMASVRVAPVSRITEPVPSVPTS